VKATDKSVSFGMAWTLAGSMDVAWPLFRLGGKPAISRQMLRLIVRTFTVSTKKGRRELGYVPQITWRGGIAEMAACCG